MTKRQRKSTNPRARARAGAAPGKGGALTSPESVAAADIERFEAYFEQAGYPAFDAEPGASFLETLIRLRRRD